MDKITLRCEDHENGKVMVQIQAKPGDGDKHEDSNKHEPDLTAGAANPNSSLQDEQSVNGTDIPLDLELQGYKCEFEDQTKLEDIQFKCNICDLVLRDPCIVGCCEAKFCSSCIKNVKDKENICPSCKKENIDYMLDRSTKRKLLGSKVYCTNKNCGCEWKDELGKLDEHLNLIPPTEKFLEGCSYLEIRCPYCPHLQLSRKDMIVHYNKMHSSNGSFVSDEVVTQEDVNIEEKRLAGTVKMQDETGEQLKIELEQMKSQFDKHDRRQTELEQQLLETKHLRKEFDAHKDAMIIKVLDFEKSLRLHKEQSLQLHNQVEMLEKKMQEQIEELKNVFQQLLEKNDSQLRVDEKREQTKVFAPTVAQPIGPVILEMPNYNERQENGDEWFSSGFYTHTQGYKMCLNVCANGFGQGKGTHISVYLYLMKGEFDEDLKWPFRGKITIQLINQSDDKERYMKTIPFSDKVPAATQRTVDSERNSTGCGIDKFFSHDEIKRYKYAKDSLRFEITKVVIDESQ